MNFEGKKLSGEEKRKEISRANKKAVTVNFMYPHFSFRR